MDEMEMRRKLYIYIKGCLALLSQRSNLKKIAKDPARRKS
jgi:hypothetical protein